MPICYVSPTGACSPTDARTPELMPSWATSGWHYYRLETETGANLRFFWAPNHQTWVVQAPSGATMEFGVPQDASSDTGGIDTTPDAHVFRWNLVRQYDAQRLPGTTHPTNIIEYVWSKLKVVGGTALVSDLTDIYDTPLVGDVAPAPASFAHHTHLNYGALGYPNSTNVSHARHNPQYLLGVDVTSQAFLKGLSPQREQVRRYVLTYTTSGHQIELSQVQLDGWCAVGAPVEDKTTGLLPPETATPACGAGPAGHDWPPATQFLYSRATLAPTFTLLPQTFSSRPPSPPATLDVNSDGMPDLVDFSSLTAQRVWLNSAVPATATNTWTSYPLTMTTPALGQVPTQMQPFYPGFVAGSFLNDAHVNAVVFDPSWTSDNLVSSSSSGIAAATYSPRWLAASSTFDWGTSTPTPNGALFPQELQNCAATTATVNRTTHTYALSACAWPWMYMGTDQPYTGMDVDGDGLQDLLVTSVYGGAYATDVYPNTNGYEYPQGTSSYYSFLNVKFSTRAPTGLVSPFAKPGPQQTSSIPPNAHTYICVPTEGCENVTEIPVSGLQLPNFCVGPMPPACTSRSVLDAPPANCGVMPGRTVPSTFGDLNGDGLPDYISLYNDHFDVSYGHGDGVFGTCTDGSTQCGCDEARPVTVSTTAQSRWNIAWNPLGKDELGQSDPALNVRFHDVDGDGYDDAIVPTWDGFDVYFVIDNTGTDSHLHVNAAAGFGWSQVNVPGYATGTSFVPDSDSAYWFADMNATGVDDVLIENPKGQVGYVDVLGGERPGLLEAIQTQNGVRTKITYRDLPSLSRQAGAAWTHQSPQSIHVVTDITTVDETPGITPYPIETAYVYSDPIYDARDRSFVGFTTVDAITVGDLVPAMHTKTQFYQGYCDDSSTTTACPRTTDYVNHALRGLPILTDITGDQISTPDNSTGPAFSTIHRRYNEEKLYAGIDGRNVHHVWLGATDTYLYDNSTGTPLVRIPSGNLVDVTVDGVTASSIWFRTNSSATHNRVTYVPGDRYGMSVTQYEYGRLDANGTATDGIISNAATVLLDSNDSTDNWIWRTYATRTLGVDASLTPLPTIAPRVVSYQYDTRGNMYLAQTNLTGVLPMARTTQVSGGAGGSPPPSTGAPPGASQNNSVVVLAVRTIDPKGTGNVTRVTQPSTSRCQDVVYDDWYAQLPTAKTIHVNGCGDAGLTTVFGNYARGLERLTYVSTPENTVTQYTYDPYGRPQSVYRPDPSTPGAFETSAGVTFAYGDTQSPRTIHVTLNDGAGLRESWTKLDGFGRSVLHASQADTSAGDAKAWVVSGQNVRNERGEIADSFPSSFQDDWTTVPLIPPGGTPLRTFQYDAFGRIIRATDLDGTQVLARKYTNGGYIQQDAAQIAKSVGAASTAQTAVTFDGHGRPLSTLQTTSTGLVTGTGVRYLPTGEPWAIERVGDDASNNTHVYQRWMQYDSLGRLVLNAEPATSTNFTLQDFNNMTGPATPSSTIKAWTYAYDDAGDLVATTDARGCGKNVVYDGAGRPQYEDYFGCTANHAPYSPPDASTGVGAEVFYKYDAAGRLSEVYDRAVHDRYHYDARGRIARIQRNVAQPDVAPSPLAGYAPHTFAQDFAYDDLDRLVGQTTGEEPDALDLNGASVPFGQSTSTSAVTLQYSGRGLLRSAGGSYGALIQAATYYEDGLPRTTKWGDLASTQTSYYYDARRRIEERKTIRSAPALWGNPSAPYHPPALSPTTTTPLLLEDDTYTLDAVGNPTQILDGRDAKEWQPWVQPVNRAITYDEFYRINAVAYSYKGAGNAYSSPSPAATPGESPLPLQAAVARPTSETFNFDPFGNLVGTSDDTQSFFDRSLGAVTIGTITSAAGATTTNQITATAGTKSPAPVASSQYDEAGNLVRLNLLRRAQTSCASPLGCDQLFDYQWDEVGRLARAQRYDFVGGSTCNGRFCILNPEPTRYVYPALPPGNPGADLRFTYDHSGQRVIRASSSYAPPPSTTVSKEYTVDVFPSLRLNETSFGPNGSSDYDRGAGIDQLALTAGGQSFGRVIYAPGDPMTSADILTGQRVLLELTDHLGSTTTVIDQATSELVERTTYSAFGRVESDYRTDRWEQFREPFKFTGKEDDVALGLTYFGARYYSPYLMTWISADPLTIHGLGADPNPYAYVRGRVMRATDPLGLDCKEGTCDMPAVPLPPELLLGFLIGTRVGGININIHFGGPPPPGAPSNPGNISAGLPALPLAAPAAEWALQSVTIGGAAANTNGAVALGGGSSMVSGFVVGGALDLLAAGPAAAVGLTMWDFGPPADEGPSEGGAPTPAAAGGSGGGGEKPPYGDLSKAGDYGIKSYNSLRNEIAGTGLNAHHLLEQRFATLMGQNIGEMQSVAVTAEEHQVFTNAWRSAIPYGNGTATATPEIVMQAARNVYANYPAILQALGL